MPRRTLSLVAVTLMATALTILSGHDRPAYAAPAVLNPGFEASGPTQTPTGWSEISATGQTSAARARTAQLTAGPGGVVRR